MAGYFFEMGKQAGKAIRQGNWVLQALTGTDQDILRAEVAVGQDLAREIKEQIGEPKQPINPESTSLVDGIGRDLVLRLKDKRRRFQFQVIDSGAPNAFALPGGFVFIEQSLLTLCGNDQPALAFVLGHEVAHIVHGHAIQRVLSQRLLGQAVHRLPVGGLPGQFARQIAGQFLTSAYSQEQEFDADAFGSRLSSAAGFEPTGAIRLLRALSSLGSGPEPFPLYAYFATHPPLEDRIRALCPAPKKSLPSPGELPK